MIRFMIRFMTKLINIIIILVLIMFIFPTDSDCSERLPSLNGICVLTLRGVGAIWPRAIRDSGHRPCDA